MNEDAPSAPKDNWSNLSTFVCETCMHFVRKPGASKLGRCRRRAPTLEGWPAVYATDWCGDHKIGVKR